MLPGDAGRHGLDRVVLAGHSIAGNELTRFAGRHPQRVRGLVYIDATFDHTRNPGTASSFTRMFGMK